MLQPLLQAVFKGRKGQKITNIQREKAMVVT